MDSCVEQAYDELPLSIPRYSVDTDRPIGAGTSCVCYRGRALEGDYAVAVKLYKKKDSIASIQFERQVSNLLSLQEPFEKGSRLAGVPPESLFVRVLDFSRAEGGRPGPDGNGALYVAVELANGSLDDHIKTARKRHIRFSGKLLRKMAFDAVRAVAGLHEKGLVHLDVKPANFLVFGERLKLSDVDGCMAQHSWLHFQDDTICFSPMFCSPELAAFLTSKRRKEEGQAISARPAFDVWPLGMTLCQLVLLEPLFATEWQRIRTSTTPVPGERRTASLLRWIAKLHRPELPPKIPEVDSDLYDLLSQWMLVEENLRLSAVQCLGHTLFAQFDLCKRLQTSQGTPSSCGNCESAQCLQTPRLAIRRDARTVVEVVF